MSVSGAGSFQNRLNQIEGSGSSFFGFADSADGVRDKVRDLAGRAQISGAAIEALVREAKDFDSITPAEKQVLVQMLNTHAAKMPDAVRAGFAGFLGVADPLPPEPTSADASDGVSRSDVMASLRVATDPSIRATFRGNAELLDCLRGNSTITRGAQGAATTEIQLALLDAGFSVGGAGADGDYGGGTANAITAFQRAKGLPTTGSVNQATLRALNDAAGPDHRVDHTTPMITGSVGAVGANSIADVKATQECLKGLGFYRGAINGTYSGTLGNAIALFEAAIGNDDHIARGGSARREQRTIRPNEDTARWLRATNAPRWQRLAASGTGWVNSDRDGHSYATNWLSEVLHRSGARYQSSYRASHPGAAAIHTNDASRRLGGDTRDHDTHEAGMDLDVKLGEGNLTWRRTAYDQEATWAMVKSFLDDPNVDKVLFNDPTLITRANADPSYAGRLVRADGHDDHFHVDLKVPTPR
ncbi:MAG: peptidoglycan-binding domain-containing protein [Planctomycetota bacterium]|jgi:peptidoglycan hydrolase-like protein with peptidoglycan-binding domain